MNLRRKKAKPAFPRDVPPSSAYGPDRLARRPLRKADLAPDLVGRSSRSVRERFDLGRHHRKAAAGLTSAPPQRWR